MKILVATDGSPCAEAAVQAVASRPWPAGSQVRVLAAGYLGFPTEDGETWKLDEAKRAAEKVAEESARRIREQSSALAVDVKVIGEEPKRAILGEAERWGADLIMVGSHGHGAVMRLLLGSVSQAIAQNAPCSVEIVRCRDEKKAN